MKSHKETCLNWEMILVTLSQNNRDQIWQLGRVSIIKSIRTWLNLIWLGNLWRRKDLSFKMKTKMIVVICNQILKTKEAIRYIRNKCPTCRQTMNCCPKINSIWMCQIKLLKSVMLWIKNRLSSRQSRLRIIVIHLQLEKINLVIHFINQSWMNLFQLMKIRKMLERIPCRRRIMVCFWIYNRNLYFKRSASWSSMMSHSILWECSWIWIHWASKALTSY